MRKKSILIKTILSAALLCSGVTLAQAPVQDIDANLHVNLAAAQSSVVQAYNSVLAAQRQNKDVLGGHAEKARQLLIQVNRELKAAALTANAAQQKK